MLPNSTPLPAGLQQELQSLFAQRFSTNAALCLQHGRDESPFAAMPPQAVVFAQSTAEVADLLKLCHAWQVPVIPYGAGTSLEGQLLALHGGISLDLSQMNQVLNVYQDDACALVQAGVTRKQLNQELHGSGLFFSVDPGADASIGGMCATRASGTNSVRYGTMRENVLALTVVLADGRIIKTANRARKSAAGYDLTHLFLGSEGTLGVITEICVKLHPLPEALAVSIASFADTAKAIQCVIQAMQTGIPLARVEFLDKQSVIALNRYADLKLAEQDLLLFEFHGSALAVAEQVTTIRQLAEEWGATGIASADKPEQRNQLWAARHQAYFALLQRRPGARAITTDCCVPISRLAECIIETQNDCLKQQLCFAIIGHVGDGNFHVLLLVDPDDQAEFARAEAVNQRMVSRALAMEGTCTGEHGVGLHKMNFLLQEHGTAALALMQQLKHSLDPGNILNPGKLLYPDTIQAQQDQV